MLPTYLSLLAICALLYHFIEGSTINIKSFLHAIFLGGYAVKDVSGFLCLWFFPAFFYFSIFKYLVTQKKYYWIIGLSTIFTIYSIYDNTLLYFRRIDAISAGLLFLTISFYINLLIRKCYSKYLIILSLIISLLTIVGLIFVQGTKDYSNYILPIPLFVLLLAISKNRYIIGTILAKCLKKLGSYSLYMYISHMLIFRAMIMFNDKYLANYWEGKRLEEGILLFCLTIVLSFLFSHIVTTLKKRKVECNSIETKEALSKE